LTIQQLHAIDNFEGLFTDPRFQALLIYLRKKRPNVGAGEAHHLIRDAGMLEGWMECLEEADKAAHIPNPNSDTKLPVPYSTSRPGLRSETNSH
jgi:hypothetical protein